MKETEKNIFLKWGIWGLFSAIVGVIILCGFTYNAFADITKEQATTAIEESQIFGGLFSNTPKSQSMKNLATAVYQDNMIGHSIGEEDAEAVAIDKAYDVVMENISVNNSTGLWHKNEEGRWEPVSNNPPNSNSQDILEPQPLDPDNPPDSTSGEPTTNEPITPSTNSSGTRPYLSIPAKTQRICAEEGLKGVDFLVFHGPLVPCGVKKACDTSKVSDPKIKKRIEAISKPCTICHFIILIKNVFDLLLSLIITASLFMLTVAGVMYIISSGGQMTGLAKGIIEKTLLGFGIFLLSWLLVYTLLNMLSVNEKFIGKGTSSTWFQFECDTESKFYTPSDNTTTDDEDDDTITDDEDDDTITGNESRSPIARL